MELPFLKEIVTIFSLAILVILVCNKIKLPAIVGFLLTGVMAGPHGFALLNDVEDVETFATIGIILLLFTVGMEFSLKKIFEYKRYFLIGGAAQVGMSVLTTIVIGFFFNLTFGESIFWGFLLSLSSTAIVLRVLDERSESDTPHGRLTVGIMIFQDIVAIPMMLVTPLLSTQGVDLDMSFLSSVAIAMLLLVSVLFAAAKIVPKLLYYIAKTRSRELFLLSVLTICFSVALLTSSIGLSLSLGAFLAGLIVSESEYRNEAVGDILPFQDLFTSFFFISIGMLLDMSFVLTYPVSILLITAFVIIVKTGAAAFASILVGVPLRTAILVGIGLSQIGEFSFVLAKNGLTYNLANEFSYQMFLAVSLITMGLTPTLIVYSSKIADLLIKLPLPSILKTGLSKQASEDKAVFKDHTIIVGFGLSGRNLARASKYANLPYLVLEMNAQTVRDEKRKGEPIQFGDATHSSVLHHVNISEASVVAVVINDFVASCRIVELIRRINPNIYIIVRTRYFNQSDLMYRLGASDVIPDEIGASIEVFTRVMNHFKVPSSRIDEIVAVAREGVYTNLTESRQITLTETPAVEHS